MNLRTKHCVSTLSTLGTVISSSMVAYALARVKFKGRQFWFTCMIMTMLQKKLKNTHIF
ncbi:MAG: hypothetical protein LUF35_07140 [Lachnospiraceae bacterium]|nr:hypothetical protein [Lachnospiraceae bacterium]